MAILPLEEAELYLWSEHIWALVFGFFSFVLAFFFLAAYLRLYRTREYYSFSIFLLIYAIYKFTQNEMFQSTIGFVAFQERLAQFCFIILPALFYLFYISFFHITDFRFSLGNFRLNKNAESLGNSYLFFSVTLGLLSAISPDLSKLLKVKLIWIILQSPFYIYYISSAIQNIKLSLRESSSFLIGVLLMCFVFLYDLLTYRQALIWDPKGGGGIFLLELSISIGLLYILIQRRLEVEKHNKYLKSIDELQHRIFGYIGSILAKPTEQVLNLIKEWGLKNSKKIQTEEITNVKSNIKEIQSNLDNLMELARLEVLNEPEYIAKINLYDFAQAVFANAKLNAHIRVDPEATIETGLDLMNSSMLYLVDFLDQQEFRNIDLVLTEQTENKILFHFLAFHSESDKVREVYSVCSHAAPLRDPRWIKWALISEIIRVMRGKIFLKRVRGRFLRISITLPRSLRSKESLNFPGSSSLTSSLSSLSLEKVKDKQKVIAILHKEDEINTQGKEKAKPKEKKANALTKEERLSADLPPAFHGQMSIGELFVWLKFKLMRKS